MQEYLQDSLLGIDEEAAIDAAKMLGQPTPVFMDRHDLLQEMQEALLIYDHLTDSIDHMNGRYLGKDFSSIETFFSIFNISEFKQEILGFMKVIDYRIVKFYGDKSAQIAEVTNVRSKDSNTKHTGQG